MTIKNTLKMEVCPSTSDPNMPTGSIAPQEATQYAINPIQNPQPQSSSLQDSPSPNGQVSPLDQANKEDSAPVEAAEELPLNKQRLQELMKEVAPGMQLDGEIEEMLLLMADDFIHTTLHSAITLAKQRHAPTVETRDIHTHLGNVWTMSIPRFVNAGLPPYRRDGVTEDYKHRMALIREDHQVILNDCDVLWPKWPIY